MMSRSEQGFCVKAIQLPTFNVGLQFVCEYSQQTKELLIIGGAVGRDYSGRRLRTIIIMPGIRDSLTVIRTTTTRIIQIPSELFGILHKNYFLL